MGIPVSGFLNQFAIDRAAQENDPGQVYLTNIDFLENGIPGSTIATMIMSPVVGYMRAIG